MTRALTSRQSGLAAQRTLRPIPLVTLTTYSDRDAETVDTVHRFSDRGLRWNGQDWLPYLQRIDPLTLTMAHVPDSEGNDGSVQREARIALRNAELDSGVYLSEQLRSENLLFARIEVAQLLLDDDEAGFDLDALPADAAVAWFRGEVRQVERMENGREIELLLASELPRVPLERIGQGSNVAPKDRGKLVPIVYGNDVLVPMLNANVGAQTTLAEVITTGESTFDLLDASEFPTSGTAMVNDEEIEWSGKSGDTLTGVLRGRGGTENRAHPQGSLVVYTPASMDFIAGQAGCDVSDVIVRNLVNDQLVRLGAAYTVDGADGALTVDGGDVTSINMTETAVQLAINRIIEQTVDQQPDFDFTGDTSVIVQLRRPLGNHTSYDPGGNYTRGSNLNGSSPTIERDFSSFNSGDDEAGIDFEYDAVQGDMNAATVNRYRITARGTFTLPDGVGSAPPTYTVTIQVRSSASNWPGAGGTLTASWVQNVTADNAGTTYDVEIIDTWVTAPEDTELADFKGESVRVQVTYSNAVNYVFEIDPTRTGIEFEIVGGGGDITRTATARINAAVGGVTLELYGKVDGPEVPAGDTSYSVAAGTVITKPPDIVRHLLVEHCGLAASAIDDASFTDADTNGEGLELRSVLTDYGDTLAPMLSAIAFQSRANVIQTEGSSSAVYKMLNAAWDGTDVRYEWPAAATTLTQWQSVDESGRDRESVANRFRVLYAIDRSIRDGGEEAFAGAETEGDYATKVPTVDLDASVDRFGVRDHGGLYLPDLFGSNPEKVAAYYMRLALEDQSVYRMRGVPWVDAYALERGDVVAFDLFYKASTVKARVIEIEKDWQSQLVDLVLVEVD